MHVVPHVWHSHDLYTWEAVKVVIVLEWQSSVWNMSTTSLGEGESSAVEPAAVHPSELHAATKYKGW